ncbi:hypothetical protein ACROYT_G002888 [Oculina patagonica]
MILFGTKQNVYEQICPDNMKTTNSGFSQLWMGSLGILSVMLMLTGGSMAAPSHGRVGHANQTPSVSNMKEWIYAYTLKLSKLIGETQTDFAQDRLGDKNYDEYIHRISGLPRPTWHQDQMSEEALLKMVVEQLFLFRGFIVEMKIHESQNKSSLFTAKFQDIEADINFVIGDLQQMQMVLGYGKTQPIGSPQPTRKPATTQKEQDEWELGVQKGFLMWLLPVQAELHRQITTMAS